MTEDKRDQLQKSYQEKAIAFKRFNDDAQRILEEAQKKELEQLEKRVLPVIQQVGKEKGFTVIFNKFNAGTRLRRRGYGRHRRRPEALQHDRRRARASKADTATEARPAPKPAPTKKPAGK